MAFRFDRLTLKSQEAVQAAQALARDRSHQRIEPMHLLAALLDPDQQVIRALLTQLGVNPAQIFKAAEEGLNSLPKVTGGEQTLGPDLAAVLEFAAAQAERMKDQYVSVEHLLLGLVKGKSKAQQLLEALGVTEKEILRSLQKVRGGMSVTGPNPEETYPALDRYGRDLVGLAQQRELDPIIGRDAEIRRVIEVLSRRGKNNPILTGKPGVGKTAIVDGLAQRIVSGDVPESLQGCRIVSLDMGALAAGTKFRGEIQERLQTVLKDVIRSKRRIILFLDELHSILGVDEPGGGLEAGNLLKSTLARGELPCIGATTSEAYREIIAKDPAIERRFQRVFVGEPSIEDTIAILRGIKERYEVHHRIRISDSALVWAAKLASIYILNRFLPDKAIDLVDEAASRLSMELRSVPTEIDVLQRKLLQLQLAQRMLQKEEEEHALERLAEVEESISQVEKQLQDLRRQWEMEKSGLGDVQKLRERLAQVQMELKQGMDNLHAVQQRGERPDERQYQELAKLDSKRTDLEKQILQSEKDPERQVTWAEETGGSRIGRVRPLLKKQVDSEKIAELVSEQTGLPFAEIFATGQTDVMSPPAVTGHDTASAGVGTTRVFISHSTDDREYVEREIVTFLKNRDLQVWYSFSDIRPSDRWERATLEGLRACDWFLVVLSPRSARSEWVKDEINFAMNYRATRIIPIMIDDCELSDFHIRMPRIQYLDFRGDIVRAQKRLLAILESQERFDLQLMSSLNDVSGIPPEGKDLIIVAAVNSVLHFRIFDGYGKVIVDTDEQRLTKQARQIEDLRKQLESLWPPHELTRSVKGRVAAAVTTIVGHTPHEEAPGG